jgi:hypothetical protein
MSRGSRQHTGGTNGRVVHAESLIVDEVRLVREDEAAKYDFDVKAILVASKKRQRRSRRRVVSFVPKKKLSA